MGGLCSTTVVDFVLFPFFLLIAVAAPLIDAQICLPQHLFPQFLVELKNLYTAFSGDYLFSEKPHFFVGLVWLELVFQWPLAVASLYGMLAGKSWFNTTCLIYGASTSASMVAAVAELLRSNRASNTLLWFYLPFLGFTVLALVRGLFHHSQKSTVSIGKRPLPQTKKRA